MKTKTLFDHIKMITQVQDPNYWDTLTDGDKKTWSSYMVHRFLSMNPDWAGIVNYAQTLDVSPKLMYAFYIDVLPKSRTWLKYIKGKKSITYSSDLIDLLCKYFELGKDDIHAYIALMDKTEMERIISLYGLDDKQKKKYLKGLT
jgi:hypothetical protein